MKTTVLAALIDGIVEGDCGIEISGVNGADRARQGDLTFATDDAKLSRAETSDASCVLVTRGARRSSKTVIRVDNPRLAFLRCYTALVPAADRGASVHPTAVVADSAVLGERVWIGPHVVIEGGVTIGDGVIIEANSVVMENCRIGASCRIHPQVTLYQGVELGSGVILHSGVVVGSDGFGYVRDAGQVHKFPQIGNVVIEDHVEIGANTTIDRGSLDDTVIGAGTKIDNLCQVAHNVRIGRNALVAAQCGFSGSATIGDGLTMGGQTGVNSNVTVGNNVTVGGKAAVVKSLPDDAVVWGIPARPAGQAKRQIAVLSWLTKHFDQVSKSIK